MFQILLLMLTFPWPGPEGTRTQAHTLQKIDMISELQDLLQMQNTVHVDTMFSTDPNYLSLICGTVTTSCTQPFKRPASQSAE